MKMTFFTKMCLYLFMFFGVFFVNIDSTSAVDKQDGSIKVACTCSYFGISDEKEFLQNFIYTYSLSIPINDNGTINESQLTMCEGRAASEEGAIFNNTSGCANKYTPSLKSSWQSSTLQKIVDSGCTVNACSSINPWFAALGIIGGVAQTKEIHSSEPSSLVQWGIVGGLAGIMTNIKAKLNAINPKIASELENSTDVGQTYNDLGEQLNLDEAKIREIYDWANPENENERTYSYADYCSLLGPQEKEFLNNLFIILCVIGIILLIVMTIIEFIKIITGSQEDGFKKVIKHTIIRIICVVILLLLPILISWIINIVNDVAAGDDRTKQIKMGEDGNPLCNVVSNG